MIRHSVIFKFKKNITEIEKQDFFTAGFQLSEIPGLENFETLKQTSPKNTFEFGFSMEFENYMIYENYNNHPYHNSFVQNYWLKMVEDFLEIDYEQIIDFSKLK
jgi:hypothetical protein